MADKKISQLDPAATSGASDFIPIVQGGVNLRTNPNILGVNYSATGVTTVTVGGLTAGSNITNQNVASILQQITSPYINPAFTSFALSGISTQEVGEKISGVQSFTWAISTVDNVQANSINITDVTNVLSLVTGHSVTSPASYDFNEYPDSGLVYETPASNVWKIQGTNTESVTFSRNLTVNWEWRRHWGISANTSLTSAQILALTSSDLSTVGTGTFTFAATNYKYFCIPSSFTQPTSFIDSATGFAVDMQPAVTVSVTNIYGVVTNYSVYRSTYPLTSTLTMVVS